MNSCSFITLTALNSTQSFGIFSFLCDKKKKTPNFIPLPPSPPPPLLYTPFPLTLMSCPVLLDLPCVLRQFFPSFLCCNIVLAFQVPHSSVQHTNLPVGPPEEFLACDYLLVFHEDTHTHINVEGEAINSQNWVYSFITVAVRFIVSCCREFNNSLIWFKQPKLQ